MPAQVVWFKRDLRLQDHAPLVRAVAAANESAAPVVCVYFIEPELINSPEWDPRHTTFISDCLRDLAEGLRTRGSNLTIIRSDLPDGFDQLAHRLQPLGGIGTVWSHEETGNGLTFDRDKRVKRWLRERAIPWNEIPQHGVFRGLRDRDGWAGRWARRMRTEPLPAPDRIPSITEHAPDWEFGRWKPQRVSAIQCGGESRAWDTLNTFLNERGVNYRADMASPISGESGCSRLSPHLAWGSISIRSVHHALTRRQSELRSMPSRERDPRWLKSLTSFQGRLRWHCHFIQKLESEPQIEFRNMHRGYDNLRNEDRSSWTDDEHDRVEAWRTGRTGYPFIDACMRCLNETGWMNFRMRSMLVSFASHHLWLHWRFTGEHLARVFTDFEPGIHWSQMQMQSGTTGINTLRIYNPIKQGLDQDPDGTFIRRWVPELAALDAPEIHEPWKATSAPRGLFDQSPNSRHETADAYPEPIIKHAEAYRAAQQRIFAIRKSSEARAEAKRVYERHGSRRRPTDPPYRGGPEDRAMA